ncbi:MAG: hypothetical protein IT577_11580 [Verrucomicrobiae bacterium]|nr:hypothetical protein [Verrucomicrobiae bacterium]
MMLSLIEVARGTAGGRPTYEILLHPFFQPFIHLLREHHQACVPVDPRPDRPPAPDRETTTALRRDEEAHFRRRAAWFLRLRWRTDEAGRMRASLGLDEAISLLRVLNDVRLFCWDRMCRPDPLPQLEHFNLQLEGFPKVGKSLLCALELCSVIQNEVARNIGSLEGAGEERR